MGKKLESGETSESGLYAVVSSKSDWVLRISMFKEFAELARDKSRYIAECWLKG